MALYLDTAYYLATALYLAAALCVFRFVRDTDHRCLNIMAGLIAAGALALAAVFAMRLHLWQRLPLASMLDALNLFVLLSTVFILVVVYRNRIPALLCFYVPPLAGIMLANAIVAGQNLLSEPRLLRGVPLAVHVGLAFCAYSLFFIAAMTSLAYMFQARRLKGRRSGGLSSRLPSLEQLDQTLYRLVIMGYPLFVTTLLLGGFWAHVQRDLLAAHWWLAPKILFSFILAAFYAIAFHMRRRGRLCEPKLATVVFWGSATLLLLYVVMEMANLRSYNFWGAGV